MTHAGARVHLADLVHAVDRRGPGRERSAERPLHGVPDAVRHCPRAARPLPRPRRGCSSSSSSGAAAARARARPHRAHRRPDRTPRGGLRADLAAAADRDRAQGPDRRARAARRSPSARRWRWDSTATTRSSAGGCGRRSSSWSKTTPRQAPPTDADLQAWLDAHAEAYARPSRASRCGRSSSASSGAGPRRRPMRRATARARCATAGPDAAIDTLGDRAHAAAGAGRAVRAARWRDVFGEDFAQGVDGDRAGAVVRPGRVRPTACTWFWCASARRRAARRSPRCARRSSASSSPTGAAPARCDSTRRCSRSTRVVIEHRPPRTGRRRSAPAAMRPAAAIVGALVCWPAPPRARRRTRHARASSSCARPAPATLPAALEAADRRRDRDPASRPVIPDGLPARDARPAAAHAGRRDRARHAACDGRPGRQDDAHRRARDHDHRRAGARAPRRRPAREPPAAPGDAVGDARRADERPRARALATCSSACSTSCSASITCCSCSACC